MTNAMILRMVLSFVTAFAFSMAATPLVIRIAPMIGAVDIPKDERRMHKKPVPRNGGMAIFFGCLVSILCFANLDRRIISIFVGATILAVVGIIDDSRGLGYKIKFIMQILAATVVVVGGDIKISIFTNPNLFSDKAFIALNDWIAIPATVLWIVLMTNAVNFIDGLDGLAVGVSAIASVSLVFVCLRLGKPDIALIAFAVVGACFGFLPFNFNPAKIFMGDTGSMFLGFMLAVLSVQGAFKSYAVISFAVPLLILGLPLFDTGFAILRRFFSGKNIMVADRGHMHHRLIDLGLSQKQVVFILYAVSAVLGITAVTLAESGALRAMLLLLGMLIVFFVGSFISSKVGKRHAARLQEDPNQQEEDGAAEEVSSPGDGRVEERIEPAEESEPAEQMPQATQEGEQDEQN